MSANDKSAATYHPHPSYTAMESAWDPERREQARIALARSIDQHRARANKYPVGDLAKQKRPKR